MSALARLTARLPQPARRAVVRAQHEAGNRARRVRFGIEEWVRARIPGRRPSTTRQRRDALSRPGPIVPRFVDLEAAEHQAAAGYFGVWARFVNGILRRDGHLMSLMEQRVASIAKEWHVVPGGDKTVDAIAAEFVTDALANLGASAFRAHLVNQACADGYSFSATEIDWRRRDGLWLWDSLAPVKHRYFQIATPSTSWGTGATEDELLLSIDGERGERLIPGQWVVTTRRLPRDLWEQGLLVPASWSSLIKIQSIANMSRSDANAGTPFWVVHSPEDALTEEDKASFQEIVEHAGEDGGGVLWGGAKVEAVTVDDRMAADAREQLAARCDADNSKLFNGGTLVDSADGKGSYALGDQHAARSVERTLRSALIICADNQEQLFRPLLDVNGIAGATPQLRLRVLPEQDPGTYLDWAVRMETELGIPVSEQQIREMTALRAPKPGEPARQQTGDGDAGAAANDPA